MSAGSACRSGAMALLADGRKALHADERLSGVLMLEDDAEHVDSLRASRGSRQALGFFRYAGRGVTPSPVVCTSSSS